MCSSVHYHPTELPHNGDQYIKFKCESHFDKDDDLQKLESAEGPVEQPKTQVIWNAIFGRMGTGHGNAPPRRLQRGGDRGGGQQPADGPPNSYCLAEPGNWWKVGEDLKLVVYVDAGPFKISFPDELCKDTIHFEADDPHCPIPECPVSLSLFSCNNREFAAYHMLR